MKSTRRRVLGASAGLLAGGSLGGCLEETALGSTDGIDSGYAAFFTLWDWAERVGGDRVSFENPVEVGRIGHGWSPDADVTRDVAASDLFVYLDTPEFAWAQDLAATIERDYDEVVAVDCLEGVNLLEWDHDHGHDGGEGGDHDGNEDADHQGDDAEQHGGDEGTDGHGGEESYDPHVWTDPVRARTMVDTIAAALADADPDNAERYETNAEEYGRRLDDLDEAFRTLVDGAERTEAVLAGHDSYRYLEDRYGFELHTPVGVAPEDQPTQSDVADTIAFVNENDVDTILHDRFESTALAETLVENSDATELATVTSAEGTTAEWADAGWGYVEQMREVTVPALEEALGS